MKNIEIEQIKSSLRKTKLLCHLFHTADISELEEAEIHDLFAVLIEQVRPLELEGEAEDLQRQVVQLAVCFSDSNLHEADPQDAEAALKVLLEKSIALEKALA